MSLLFLNSIASCKDETFKKKKNVAQSSYIQSHFKKYIIINNYDLYRNVAQYVRDKTVGSVRDMCLYLNILCSGAHESRPPLA